MADEDYAPNAVKQNPDLREYLAQKTGLGGAKGWRVFRPDGKPHFVEYADIENWADLEPKTEV